MQLHRDTTVQSLTVTPSLKDGQIYFEDSPIVKAAKYGRVLVLDVSKLCNYDTYIYIYIDIFLPVHHRKPTKPPLRLWLF